MRTLFFILFFINVLSCKLSREEFILRRWDILYQACMQEAKNFEGSDYVRTKNFCRKEADEDARARAERRQNVQGEVPAPAATFPLLKPSNSP